MDDKTRRQLGWLLLLVGASAVIIFVIASLRQKPVPPGTAIVNMPVPPRHPERPCYVCHQGMAPAAAFHGRKPPAKHPAQHCEQCHEGYQRPAGTPPGPVGPGQL